MTTSRRRHPAQASRVLAAGIATASMLGLGASMAISAPPAKTATVQPAVPTPGNVTGRRAIQPSPEQAVPGPATPSASGTVQQPRSRTRGS